MKKSVFQPPPPPPKKKKKKKKKKGVSKTIHGPSSQFSSFRSQPPRYEFRSDGPDLCQFIEIVHKIINWYMKNAKYLFVSVI